MPVVELNESSINDTIEKNAIVLIDFWAPWCGPCRSFAPVFEASSNNHVDVIFGKVNTEIERNLAAAFEIRSIPTLMIFRDQILLFSQAGALSPGQLENLVSKVKELDMQKVRQDIETRKTKQA